MPFRSYYGIYLFIACKSAIGWLVGCFGFNGPLRQYFSLYRAVSQREGERIDESKNVKTTPTRTYCKCSRPLPYRNPNCRTPRHWKFTQHHRTTRPPPCKSAIGLFQRVVCDKKKFFCVILCIFIFHRIRKTRSRIHAKNFRLSFILLTC